MSILARFPTIQEQINVPAYRSLITMIIHDTEHIVVFDKEYNPYHDYLQHGTDNITKQNLMHHIVIGESFSDHSYLEDIAEKMLIEGWYPVRLLTKLKSILKIPRLFYYLPLSWWYPLIEDNYVLLTYINKYMRTLKNHESTVWEAYDYGVFIAKKDDIRLFTFKFGEDNEYVVECTVAPDGWFVDSIVSITSFVKPATH
jgi:hypothetical protein